MPTTTRLKSSRFLSCLLAASFTLAISNEALARRRCESLFGHASLSPVFKIRHDRFYELGTDGITYINPGNAAWSEPAPGRSRIRVESTSSTKETPEGSLFIRGTVRKSHRDGIVLQSLDRISQHMVTFSESPLMWGHADVLRIRAASSDPNRIHSLVIGDEKAELLRLSFQAPRHPTDLLIPLPRRSVNQVVYSSSLKFEWRYQVDSDSPSEFDLQIYGPLTFERQALLENSRARQFVLEEAERTKGAASAALLDLALKSLANPAHQNQALEIGRQGLTAVRRELKPIGVLDEVIFNKKVDSRTFFNHSELAQLARKKRAAVPFEKDEFGFEHGPVSHGLQLIAISRGMSPRDFAAFLAGPYLGFFNSTPRQWASWDIVVDAPGDSAANAPLWWRRRLQTRIDVK